MTPEKHLDLIDKDLQALFLDGHINTAPKYVAGEDLARALDHLKEAFEYEKTAGQPKP